MLSLYPQRQGQQQKLEPQPIQQHEGWETAEWGHPRSPEEPRLNKPSTGPTGIRKPSHQLGKGVEMWLPSLRAPHLASFLLVNGQKVLDSIFEDACP